MPQEERTCGSPAGGGGGCDRNNYQESVNVLIVTQCHKISLPRKVTVSVWESKLFCSCPEVERMIRDVNGEVVPSTLASL